jgi:hypothetical protein
VNKILRFGQTLDGYDVPVLNEREVRAAAGILFMFAMISFMNAWLTGNFLYTRVFVIAFLIDFSIRIFVNPDFAPTMIAGRLFVRHQAEEYVGAPQKRFAWSIGLLLAITMFFLIVVNNVIGPINLFICLICLLLLFFESAFGICLACKVYDLAFRGQARHCPGDVCEVNASRRPSRISVPQAGIALAFVMVVLVAGRLLSTGGGMGAADGTAAGAATTQAAATAGRDCTVPDWAVAIGHADMWKLHNNCLAGSASPIGTAAAAAPAVPTVEIIAMAHPPVQQALKPLRDGLAAQGSRVRVVEIDAESPQGEARLAAIGLKGHIPILVLIDGKYRFQRGDGSTIELRNFPAAASNPMGLNGTWRADDVQAILARGAR